jgi:hypothetical protein
MSFSYNTLSRLLQKPSFMQGWLGELQRVSASIRVGERCHVKIVMATVAAIGLLNWIIKCRFKIRFSLERAGSEVFLLLYIATISTNNTIEEGAVSLPSRSTHLLFVAPKSILHLSPQLSSYNILSSIPHASVKLPLQLRSCFFTLLSFVRSSARFHGEF